MVFYTHARDQLFNLELMSCIPIKNIKALLIPTHLSSPRSAPHQPSMFFCCSSELAKKFSPCSRWKVLLSTKG